MSGAWHPLAGLHDRHGVGEVAGVRHRQVDLARPALLRPSRQPAAQPHGRLRPPGDLDLPPGEGPRDAEPERLAACLLPREPPGIALRGVRAGLAIGTFRLREAAFAEARVAVERPANAVDLDQVDADPVHPCSSSHSGRCAIDDTIPSGRTRVASTASGRNFPVRTSTVRMPCACAPAMSDSMSSPIIQVMSASASSASRAASKYAVEGLPSTIASVSAAYSGPTTSAPESRSGPCFVCHQRFLCKQ